MGPLDHLSLRYLRQVLDMSHPTDEPFVLNPVESRIIRRTKRITLTVAALLGVLGVVLFYGPLYSWPYWFGNTTIRLGQTTYSIPLATTLYGALLVYLEMNALLAINLWGVRTIMEVCQFPRAYDAQYDRNLQALAQATLQTTWRGALRLSIDPYLTIPRWGLTIYFLLTFLKGLLSSLVIKTMLRRFALLPVIDLMGMPIYAFWNAWASWQVLHEAQVRVMAPITIREFTHELHEEWGQQAAFKTLMPEALRYMALWDEQHNYASFLLIETLIDRFDLPRNAPLPGNFLTHMAQAPAPVQRGIERLLVFATLIDGKVSWREERLLRQLRRKQLLTYSMADIRRMKAEYNQGHGLWV